MEVSVETFSGDEVTKLFESYRQESQDSTDVLPRDLVDKIVNLMSTKHMSDSVLLPIDEAEILSHFWETKDGNNMCPVDLIVQQTVPLPCLEIIVADGKGAPVIWQFVVFEDDSFEQIDTKGITGTIVGTLMYRAKGNKYKRVIPLVQLPSEDYVAYLSETIDIQDNGKITSYDPQEKEAQKGFVSFALSVWYGLQIMLLHPVLKELFSHGKNVARFDPTGHAAPKKNKKKRITYNVKTHYIKSGAIQDILHAKSKREFTTLAWYVIGHWRKYKDGKQIFIHGYWKGPLREMKQNLDDGRERKIDVTEIV